VTYPDVETMEAVKLDPFETFFLHDNAFPTMAEDADALEGQDVADKKD